MFVRDLQTGTTTLVSLDTAGTESSGPSFGPSISADGRYVAFNSEAFDLVPGDGNPYSDIFVRDRQTGITTRASVDIGGGDPNGFSFFPSISDNGRYVAFESGANDLVHGDGTSGTAGVDVFVHDRQTASTTRASVDTTGGDPNSSSRSTDISGGGRFVSFKSDASDLVPADGNSASDVFVRDLQRGATRRVSVDFSGEEANGGSVSPSISDDGRYAAFDSGASDLVGGDGNDLFDTFVRVVDRPTIDSVTPDTIARGTTATLTVTGSGFFPGAQATASAFTENGVTVNSVTVLAETELAVSVSVDADAPTGTRHLAVWNPGTGPGAFATAVGVCAECLTVT